MTPESREIDHPRKAVAKRKAERNILEKTAVFIPEESDFRFAVIAQQRGSPPPIMPARTRNS